VRHFKNKYYVKKNVPIFVFVLSSFLAVGQKTSEKNKETKQVILFVCEHGAARSTIAAAYFNKLAKEKELNFKAVFRGTDPDTILTKGTENGLLKDGFDIKDWAPKLVSEQDIKDAYKVVTFDCKLPIKDSISTISVEQWDGIPPISKDYDVARNKIVEKVNQLIIELPMKKKNIKMEKRKESN
jgi:arsenate reductase